MDFPGRHADGWITFYLEILLQNDVGFFRCPFQGFLVKERSDGRRENRASTPENRCLEESLCPALGRIARLGIDGPAGTAGGGAAFRSAPVERNPRGSAFPLPDALCPRRLGIEQVERPGRTGTGRRSGVSSRQAAAIWASAGAREWPRKTAWAFCPSGESPRRKGLPASAGRSD